MIWLPQALLFGSLHKDNNNKALLGLRQGLEIIPLKYFFFLFKPQPRVSGNGITIVSAHRLLYQSPVAADISYFSGC